MAGIKTNLYLKKMTFSQHLFLNLIEKQEGFAMVNHYEFVKDHPQVFKQFSCKELLFLIIDCPPEFTQSEDLVGTQLFYLCDHGKSHGCSAAKIQWIISTGQTVFHQKRWTGDQKN
jgi:hypothetical protein